MNSVHMCARGVHWAYSGGAWFMPVDGRRLWIVSGGDVMSTANDDEYEKNLEYIRKLRSEVVEHDEKTGSNRWGDVASSIDLDVLSDIIDSGDDDESDAPTGSVSSGDDWEFNSQLLNAGGDAGVPSAYDGADGNAMPFKGIMRQLLKYWKNASFDREQGIMIDGVGYVTGIHEENGQLHLTTR